MIYSSPRQFQMWDYNVSHKQLLLRSPATPEVSKNVDIVFWGVKHLCVPTVISGVRLDVSPDEDGSLRRYHIDPADRQQCVLAAGVKVLINDLDIFESTLVYFCTNRPIEWFGEVVAQS